MRASFDPRRSDDRPVGHGTAFRIDPWSRCLTAFHVLEDLFEVDEAGTGAVLQPGLRLAALEVEETGFGLIGLRADAWRPLAGSYAFAASRPRRSRRRVFGI
jgi:serine protease Do